jgi:hypothetical protein
VIVLRIEDSTSRCSSGVEHFLGKEEVVSSILINGSDQKKPSQASGRGKFIACGNAKLVWTVIDKMI